MWQAKSRVCGSSEPKEVIEAIIEALNQGIGEDELACLDKLTRKYIIGPFTKVVPGSIPNKVLFSSLKK